MKSLSESLLGSRVDFATINAVLINLADRWRGACNVLANGETGWYRRLGDDDRVGIVATAHAISALRLAGAPVINDQAVVRTLVARRRDDGAWPFISNLGDVGVVDATASTILALYEWQDAVEFRAMNLRPLLQGSLDWLEQSALADGGWGIIAGSPYRNYSTALAIQTLCKGGRRSSPVVQRSLSKVISLADPATGAWHDASRKLSVPVSSEVIRALTTAAADHSRYAAQISKACEWILTVGRQTNLWEAGSATARLEEVDVTVGTRFVRIEYGHSPRSVAITALSCASFARTPEVVAAVNALIADLNKNRWDSIAGVSSSEPTSWMMYDATAALVTFQKAFSQHTEIVWSDNRRVVEHFRGDGILTRLGREHSPKLLITGGCVVIAWLLVKSGVIPGWGLATALFLLATIALNVISNFVSDFVREHRTKD
jgi:hypothetical protein